MTKEREEAIISAIKEMGVFRTPYPNSEVEKVVSKLIKQSNSDEDCISRQAVLEIAKSSKSNWIDNSVLFKRVNELPPVVPKPKTDVLAKIRAEIEQVKYIMNEEIINHDRKDLINFVNGLNQSLAIIDKYKAESEDKE